MISTDGTLISASAAPHCRAENRGVSTSPNRSTSQIDIVTPLLSSARSTPAAFIQNRGLTPTHKYTLKYTVTTASQPLQRFHFDLHLQQVTEPTGVTSQNNSYWHFPFLLQLNLYLQQPQKTQELHPLTNLLSRELAPLLPSLSWTSPATGKTGITSIHMSTATMVTSSTFFSLNSLCNQPQKTQEFLRPLTDLRSQVTVVSLPSSAWSPQATSHRKHRSFYVPSQIYAHNSYSCFFYFLQLDLPWQPATENTGVSTSPHRSMLTTITVVSLPSSAWTPPATSHRKHRSYYNPSQIYVHNSYSRFSTFSSLISSTCNNNYNKIYKTNIQSQIYLHNS